MPQDRKTDGEGALSNAERQARHRARMAEQAPVVRYRWPADRRSRPQRWRDAVSDLLALQTEYIAWLDVLPDGLHGSATAEALQAIADLNLDTLADIEPSRGYGRD